MVGTIFVDAANTFWGQPRSYWTSPSTAHEHNTFVRFFAKLGYQQFILYWIVYTLIALFIVSRVPRRFALIAIFAFILPHYFGATSWWVYSWGFGQNAATVYGFALAVALGMSFVSKGTDSQ